MDRLDAITAFVAVARHGGFSAAGRAMGAPVATISRKVALLEEALGVRLFVRTTRHVALTEGGQRYFEACSRVIDDLRDADEAVTGEYRQPKGDLVLTAPLGFGQQHLQPVVHEFLRAHPQVNVHLQLADRVLALVEEHVDCALRIGTLADSTLVAREVGTVRTVVCASPAYLAARGEPADLAALAGHDCISWTGLGPQRTWALTLRQDGNDAVLRVADTGEGMEPETLSRIFDRFYRADQSRSLPAGRTGLGLAITKSIVEAHNGTITVESTPGKGTTFTVRVSLA